MTAISSITRPQNKVTPLSDYIGEIEDVFYSQAEPVSWSSLEASKNILEKEDIQRKRSDTIFITDSGKDVEHVAVCSNQKDFLETDYAKGLLETAIDSATTSSKHGFFTCILLKSD